MVKRNAEGFTLVCVGFGAPSRHQPNTAPAFALGFFFLRVARQQDRAVLDVRCGVPIHAGLADGAPKLAGLLCRDSPPVWKLRPELNPRRWGRSPNPWETKRKPEK
jgi:hypothetical protein